MKTILILLIILVVLIMICYIYLKNRVQEFSQKFFGGKDLIKEIQKRGKIMNETPKNPYGMENLVLPQIEKDFPNININEMKSIAEKSLIKYYNSLKAENVDKKLNISEKLKLEMNEQIQKLNDENYKLKNIKINKTVLNQYLRKESQCSIIFQTSVRFSLTKNSEKIVKEERINIEFIYIYNNKHVESNESISLHCPNCGAPVEGLGAKKCQYCQGGIIDLVEKTWMLNSIRIV